MLLGLGKRRPQQAQPQEHLDTSTIRQFDGGLNVVDTDLNMSPKYAKVLDNLERALDGSLKLRPGTRYFANINQFSNSADIVNITYFNDHIIAVQTTGVITKTDASGTVSHMQIGAADPWTATTFVSFTIFNSDLIICNGVNKPLLISGNPVAALYMELDYLQDLATLSNVNTPIGMFVASHAQYTIVAGVSTAPSTIYISSRGTSGTYVGDAAPNDGIALDLGPRVSLGSATITGLVAYRDKLLVTFERGVLPVNLGVYTGSPAVHTPSDDGFIEEFGCLSHRSLASVGDDTFYCDNIGVNSIQRVATFNTLRPVRASQYIDPEITSRIQPLTPAQIARYVFSVYDLRNKRYMVFVPVFTGSTITETICYSYTNIPTLKVAAWARLRGWLFSAACRTSLQNVFFARGTKLYYYDYDNATINADRYADADVNSGTGEAIAFEWELPWADFGKRMHAKQSRYMHIETEGTATFTVNMYIDNIVTYNSVDSPYLTMDFVGGDSGGYGASPYGGGPFGGGRNTSDERLYGWPAKFNIMKLKFLGSTKAPLQFVSISVAYLRRSIRR